jgi:hypothetical protein
LGQPAAAGRRRWPENGVAKGAWRAPLYSRVSQSDRWHRYVPYEGSEDARERVRRLGPAYGWGGFRPDSGGRAGI